MFRRNHLIVLLLAFIVTFQPARAVAGEDGNGNAEPRAVNGILDLQGYDFESRGPLTLAGEWGFYWDIVVSPENFNNVISRPPDLFVEVPSYWDNLDEIDPRITPRGVATYSLKILTNKDDAAADLALKFLSITPNADIFIDGVQVAEIGNVDSDKTLSESGNRIFLTPVPVKSSSFDLTVSISNYHNVNGGLNRPIQIGLYDDILKKRELKLSLDALFLGGLILMGLYQLSLFLLNRRQITSLYMAILCFMAFFFSGFKNEMVLLSLFPGWDGEIRTRFIYLCLTIAGPLLTLYASSLYPAQFRKKINWLLLSIAVVFSVIIIFTSKAFYTHFIIPLEALILVSSLYTIVMLVADYYKSKDRHILYYLSGLGFLVLSIVFSIVDNENSFMFQSAAGIFFVFIFYQAFLQAYIFSNAFTEIDTLSEQKQKLEKRNVELFSLSYIDNLTETCNRRLMDDFLSSNWRVNAFSERSVGIILIDIDNFSNYNNFYGHKQGDACLVKVCGLLRDELSQIGQDTLARYGGEEFAVIVSDMDEDKLYHMGERLRKSVESGMIAHPSSRVSDVVTISVGCASMIPSRDELPELLLDAAGKAIYDAKKHGKNRTVLYKSKAVVLKWEPKLV